MSIYELVDYDALMDRAGIPHGQAPIKDAQGNPTGTFQDLEWFCGANPPLNYTYDELGIEYDDVLNYDGRSYHGAGGLCLTADINVNGLTLNTKDANGTIWLCTGIDGWWTLPPSEILDVPRPYWDGSMLTTGRYLSRTVTISGCFIPPDASLVWKNRDRILRSCGIVRGVGLLATCGNQSPSNTETLRNPDGTFYLNTNYDPSKMAIIQTADVPLVDTIRPDGFTQFSLSFRCAYPTKSSIKERVQAIAVPPAGVEIGRSYDAFSLTEYAGSPDANEDTSYTELKEINPTLYRKYDDVKFYNPDAKIKDEASPARLTGIPAKDLTFHNGGNYFAFPTVVIQQTQGITPTKTLKITNDTTTETLTLVKEIAPGNRLVVDSQARRVALVTEGILATPDAWKWTARDYLALESEWLSLAPGDNRFIVQKATDVATGAIVNGVASNMPTVYWRDTWIG